MPATPPVVSSDIEIYEQKGLVPAEVYEKATLYVPEASVDDYKEAPYWNRFINIKTIEHDFDGVNGTLADDVSVTVRGNEIHIDGFEGTVRVLTMSGQTVYSGSANTITVANGGAYIVRAGGKR